MTKNGQKRALLATGPTPRLVGVLCAVLFLALLMTFVSSCGDDDLAVGGNIIIPTLPPGFETPTP